MTHELKIHPRFFEEVFSGKKNFEVRKNDRNFHVGDKLILKEYIHGEYTGEEIEREITYILDDENYCKEDYVILGIRPQVDAEPMKHGKWLLHSTYNPCDSNQCSVCGIILSEWSVDMKGLSYYRKFCPHCGARMDGE